MCLYEHMYQIPSYTCILYTCTCLGVWNHVVVKTLGICWNHQLVATQRHCVWTIRDSSMKTHGLLVHSLASLRCVKPTCSSDIMCYPPSRKVEHDDHPKKTCRTHVHPQKMCKTWVFPPKNGENQCKTFVQPKKNT